ncbi:MAG TPA: peptidoglycan-associated lipoprotein Pal [Candidatus Angelobacter sp.]|nr:peptidoglycan-associated lipoprotein Pal [Candidatus Angelobacter sp.]
MNQSKRYLTSLLAVLFFLVLVTGCKKKQPTPPPPPPPAPKPVTATLTANPASIERGQSSTLTWSTENADQITLDGKAVDASGSQSVSPTQTTTYHLSATGKAGTQTADAQIAVTVPPPPPVAPPPPPPPNDDAIFAQNVQDIYFDYDKFDLRADSQQALARAAQAISQHPNWKVRIEGNCDERGSTEYNLTLGENRANAAKQALTQAGVTESQLQTISYGKEKPVCTEANDDCWQKNRHDHFVLIH